MIIRMLKELSKNFNSMKKDTEIIFSKTEMRNTLEEINTRLGRTEDQISNLEEKVAENTQSKQQKQTNTKPQK